MPKLYFLRKFLLEVGISLIDQTRKNDFDMFLKNIIPIAPILTHTESPSVDTLDKNTPPQAGLLGMLAYLFLAHLKGGVMSACSSVCVSSVVCPSCVRQQLVYTFFVGSYLFNALTYQVHIWCEDTLGQ